MGSQRLQLSVCTVDLRLHEVARGDERLSLTKREVALLEYLVERDGQPVSKEQLHVDVFGYSPRVVSRAADYAVFRLRRKLERDPSAPDHVLTVPGVGYRLLLGRAEATPPARADSTSSNLPAETSTFVGRDRDLEGVGALLESGTRLVTVVGAAGVGKTRVARRAAARWFEAGRGSVLFCDLTEARSQDGVCSAVAQALELGPLRGECADVVGTVLESRGRSLLVLDNFEQVVQHAQLVTRWLTDAPDLVALVTSRERLRVDGERLYELLSLDPTADGAALFLERAREARPRLVLGPEERAVVRELVRQLDGLPLAIELAAARSAVWSPQQILDRLAERFESLGRGRRDTTHRQATLERAVGWSWELLDDHERRALAQVSAFRGGFDVEAAEALVLVGDDAPPVSAIVQALREKSLLREVQGSISPRFDLLLSVRDFAEARCEDLEGVHLRHAGWAVERARSLSGQVRELGVEHENVAVAMERLAGTPHTALYAEAVLAGAATWMRSGGVDAWLPHLERALAAASLDDALRLRLHLARARVLAEFGRARSEAHADCAVAVDLAGRLGDQEGLVRAHLLQSSLFRQERRLGMAWTEHAAATKALSGSPGPLHAQAWMQAANLCCEQGEYRQARRYHERSLELCGLGEDPALEQKIALNLAILLGNERRFRQQAEFASRAVALTEAAGDPRVGAKARLCQAEAEADLGLLQEASQGVDEALVTFQRIGDRWLERFALVTRATLELARGEVDEADLSLRRARATLGLASGVDKVAVRAWSALVAWARWDAPDEAADVLGEGLAELDAIMPSWGPFFESKAVVAALLAGRLDVDEARDRLEGLRRGASESRDVASARAVAMDLGHVLLVSARREGETDSLLGQVQAMLDRAPGRPEGVKEACSRVLLAGAMAELSTAAA